MRRRRGRAVLDDVIPFLALFRCLVEVSRCVSRQTVIKVEGVYDECIDECGSFSRSRLSWHALGTICM